MANLQVSEYPIEHVQHKIQFLDVYQIHTQGEEMYNEQLMIYNNNNTGDKNEDKEADYALNVIIPDIMNLVLSERQSIDYQELYKELVRRLNGYMKLFMIQMQQNSVCKYAINNEFCNMI